MSTPSNGSVSFDFSGRDVLVTGASRGIGYTVAQEFARAGANLVLLADDNEVFAAAERIDQAGRGNVQPLRCDITDSNAVKACFAGVDNIDVLVNNAGLERITPLDGPEGETENTFRRVVETNVVGTFLVSRAAVARMPAGSSIVVTGSIWSRTAVGEFSAYCSSKHASLGLLRSLAVELAPRGIRVNGVCPGWVRTETSMLSLRRMTERSGRSEQEELENIVANQLLDGLMEPDDVTGAFLFLASDSAASITGQTISVDRGEHMC